MFEKQLSNKSSLLLSEIKTTLKNVLKSALMLLRLPIAIKELIINTLTDIGLKKFLDDYAKNQ